MRWSKATCLSEMISVYDDDDSKALHIDCGHVLFFFILCWVAAVNARDLFARSFRVSMCVCASSPFSGLSQDCNPHLSSLFHTPPPYCIVQPRRLVEVERKTLL